MLTADQLLAHAETLTDSVQLADRILRAGLLLHASDVHLDPSADSVRVRFRIDGELEDVLRVPAAMQSALTSRLKVLASLDIAERRAPQDGGFTWRPVGMGALNQSPLDVRMATLPVRHGERITLRLLEVGGRRLTMDDLGMSVADRALFDKVLRRPFGLVLLTGPTGSGKTTTLYAAINELLKDNALNVITVEDPIEYEIPGVAQAEVDAADKVNFAKALKSILRHDPDVVMIGEIRDADSLDAAVKAALTGHLVLSTLHANGAKATITRLTDMGLDPNLVSATLRLSVAQRLVRRLCPTCREAYEPTDAELALLGRARQDVPTLWRAKGCADCGGRGYSGRIGLFELYEPSMTETAFRPMQSDAREKVLSGATSLAEIIRVLGD